MVINPELGIQNFKVFTSSMFKLEKQFNVKNQNMKVNNRGCASETQYFFQPELAWIKSQKIVRMFDKEFRSSETSDQGRYFVKNYQ